MERVARSLPQANIDLQSDATTVQLELERILELLKTDRRFRQRVRLLIACEGSGWVKIKLVEGNLTACNFETV